MPSVRMRPAPMLHTVPSHQHCVMCVAATGTYTVARAMPAADGARCEGPQAGRTVNKGTGSSYCVKVNVYVHDLLATSELDNS